MMINIKSEAPRKTFVSDMAVGKLFVGVVGQKQHLMFKNGSGIVYYISSYGEVLWYCSEAEAGNFIDEVKFISSIDVVIY